MDLLVIIICSVYSESVRRSNKSSDPLADFSSYTPYYVYALRAEPITSRIIRVTSAKVSRQGKKTRLFPLLEYGQSQQQVRYL